MCTKRSPIKQLHLLGLMAAFCLGIASHSYGQENADIGQLRNKYQGFSAIIQQNHEDITIDFAPKKGIVVESKEFESRLVLTDNAGTWSSAKKYLSAISQLKRLEAYTLVEQDGKIKKYEVEDFQKTSETDDDVYYSDLIAYNYNYKSVAKGASLITESEVTIADPFMPLVFTFANYLPVQHASYSIKCHQDIDIQFRLYGLDTAKVKSTISHKGKYKIYEWSATDMISYNEDEYAPDYLYFVPHVVVQVAGYTRKGVYTKVVGSVNDLYANNYGYIAKLPKDIPPTVQSFTDSLTHNCNSVYSKVKRIFEFVQIGIKYVAIEDGDNGVVPRDPEMVLKRRFGDCKDKSCLLVYMIRAAGGNASFAWLGTRSLPYQYNDLASALVDNHMVAVWWSEPKTPSILDATTHKHSFTHTPAQIQGKECLIALDSTNYFLYKIPLDPPETNAITDSLWVQWADGKINGKGKRVCVGENRARLLTLFSNADSLKYHLILENTLPVVHNKLKISSVHVSNLNNVDSTFVVDYQFSIPDYYIRKGNEDYLNLNVLRYLSGYKLKTDRKVPVSNDYKHLYKSVIILDMPDSKYAITDMPGTTEFGGPNFGFTQTYNTHTNQVVLTTQLKLDFFLLEGNAISNFVEMLNVLQKTYLKTIIIRK